MTSSQSHFSPSTFSINAHMLAGQDVVFRPSPNHSGPFKHKRPDIIIVHFTGGSSLTSSVELMTSSNNKVSAHLVIGRSGSVVQMVPFDKVAWHAGRSEWLGRSKLNRYAIGIELDNAGQLQPNGNGQYLSWYGGSFRDQDVYQGIHRNQQQPTYWHCYTEAQIMQTFAVCQLLCEHYKIQAILGHEEVSPGRKVDPGPAFPLDKLRDRLLANNVHSAAKTESFSEENRLDKIPQVNGDFSNNSLALTTASHLNVRSGPGPEFSLASAPLIAGTHVTVVRQQGDWVQVTFDNTGWVSRRYLAPIRSLKDVK